MYFVSKPIVVEFKVYKLYNFRPYIKKNKLHIENTSSWCIICLNSGRLIKRMLFAIKSLVKQQALERKRLVQTCNLNMNEMNANNNMFSIRGFIGMGISIGFTTLLAHLSVAK